MNMKRLEAAFEDTSIASWLHSSQGPQTFLRKTLDTTKYYHSCMFSVSSIHMQKKRIKKFSFFRIYSFPNTLSLAILLGFLFKNSTSDRLLGPCFIVAAS